MLRQGFSYFEDRKIYLRRSDCERTTADGSTNQGQSPVLSGEADPRGHTSHCKISGQRDRVALYRDTEIGFDGEETNQLRSKNLACGGNNRSVCFPKKRKRSAETSFTDRLSNAGVDMTIAE